MCVRHVSISLALGSAMARLKASAASCVAACVAAMADATVADDKRAVPEKAAVDRSAVPESAFIFWRCGRPDVARGLRGIRGMVSLSLSYTKKKRKKSDRREGKN